MELKNSVGERKFIFRYETVFKLRRKLGKVNKRFFLWPLCDVAQETLNYLNLPSIS